MTHPLGALAPLAAWPQFIPVRLVPQSNDKANKLPVDYRTGQVTEKGSEGAHNPAIWLPFDQAATHAARLGQQWHAVGFVLTDADPWHVVDIDHALLPDRTWAPHVHEIARELPGAVAEVSQSGRGLHYWARHPKPIPHGSRRAALNIEAYSRKRFIVIGSGQVGDLAERCDALPVFLSKWFAPVAVNDDAAPSEGPRADWKGPDDDDELLRRALASRSAGALFDDGLAFAEVFNADADALRRKWPAAGRADGLPYDASSADASLFVRLAWWAGCDADRMLRLAQRSGLVRDKWGRSDYIRRTIARACAQCRDVYREGTRGEIAAPATVATLAPQSFAFSEVATRGALPATIERVADALASPESGMRVAYDAFLDTVMVAGADGVWRPLTDVLAATLRAEFGRRGFRPISAEIMRSALLIVAEANRFDSALQWLASLTWDGVPRVDLLLPSYFSAPDTAYSRAVGAYLMTAAAGRVLTPGVQADMAVVLTGGQGVRKTSALQALCPTPEGYREADLHKLNRKDEELARGFRGALIAELPELRGLATRDQESIKAWISRRVERWRPVFREFEVSYPRRAVLIGTTNADEFLDDATGERRWLPVRVGQVDIAALERDRDQLWAEGAARFRAAGVAWQQAEELARAEHAAFKVRDPWQERIEAWLSTPPATLPGLPQSNTPPGAAPFTVDQVMTGALGLVARDQSVREGHRVGKILRALGYEKGQHWVGGRNVKAWCRVASPSIPSHERTG